MWWEKISFLRIPFQPKILACTVMVSQCFSPGECFTIFYTPGIYFDNKLAVLRVQNPLLVIVVSSQRRGNVKAIFMTELIIISKVKFFCRQRNFDVTLVDVSFELLTGVL